MSRDSSEAARPEAGRPGSSFLDVETRLPREDVACSLLARDKPPLFIEPVPGRFGSREEALAWLQLQRPLLDGLILEHGAIVLRGFLIGTAEDFDRAIGMWPPYERGYLGGNSPREVVTGKVLEATRMDASLRLPVHSEMAYLDQWPARIAFFCRAPAARGGETIIADLRAVSRRLPASIREQVAKLGIRVVRNYAPPSNHLAGEIAHPDAVPWNKALRSDDRAEVESRCAELGMRCTWNGDGSLTLVNEVEGFATHPRTGQSIYRTTIHHSGRALVAPPPNAGHQALPTGTTLGDGTNLSEEDRTRILGLLDEETLSWPWRAGDLMILDNLQIAHGRNPYEGERETLVALLA